MRIKLIKFRGERSQEEMARKYGVSQQSWSYWERGVKNPSALMMKRIEEDSGVPMEVLFPDIFKNPKIEQSN